MKLDAKVNNEIKTRGLIHVDGKKEFAFDLERNIMLVDTFGTADEDRFWDSEKYQNGEFVELSKEFVRQHYKNINYYSTLEKAREAKESEPDIPPLDDVTVDQVSKLYVDIYEKISGEKFK